MPATSRCEQCKKKLGLLGIKCKCGKDLCITHIAYEAHTCSFDYKSEAIERLKKDIDVGKLNEKLEKI